MRALLTHFNTLLCFDSRTATLTHRPPATIDSHVEIVCLLDGHTPTLVVASQSGGATIVDPYTSGRHVPVPRSITALQHRTDITQLNLAFGDFFMSAVPDGRIATFATEASDWENFTLIGLLAARDLIWLMKNSWSISAPERLVDAGDIVLRGAGIDFGGLSCAVSEGFPLVEAIRADGPEGVALPLEGVLIRDGWKADRVTLYRPLIVYVACGQGDILAQLALSSESLVEFGLYTGSVLILTDLDNDDVLGHVAAPLREQTKLVHIQVADRNDAVCARLLLGELDVAAQNQPILYVDADVIFDAPLDPVLHRLAQARGISAQVETFYPPIMEAAGVGAQLFAKDPVPLENAFGFCAGVFGIPNLHRYGAVLRLARRTLMAYTAQYGRDSIINSDQAVLNYMSRKLGALDSDVIDSATRIPFDSQIPDAGDARGFVHFWPFGRGEWRLETMRAYCDQLKIKRDMS